MTPLVVAILHIGEFNIKYRLYNGQVSDKAASAFHHLYSTVLERVLVEPYHQKLVLLGLTDNARLSSPCGPEHYSTWC